MAKFLSREGIVHHLHKIIQEAEEELVLISPYIKADEETKNLLKDTRRGTPIHVIYGKSQSERNLGNVKDSFDLPGITVSFRKNLHAKCYLNEKQALLTSMNLHKYSQENNDEMGILVSRQDDPKLYEDIYQQASRWKADSSQPYTASASKPKAKVAETPAQIKQPAEKKPQSGFCIRCKTVVAANPKKPYCATCYESWSRYSNNAYKEKHCHTCGRKFAATLLKPLCTSCYAKYKDIFQFATAWPS